MNARISLGVGLLGVLVGCEVRRAPPEPASATHPAAALLVMVSCESESEECRSALTQLACPGVVVTSEEEVRRQDVVGRAVLRVRVAIARGEGATGPFQEVSAHLDELVCATWVPRESSTTNSSATIDLRSWVCRVIDDSVARLRSAGDLMVKPPSCY